MAGGSAGALGLRRRALSPTFTTVSVTGTTPSITESISAAAAFERSTIRPATKGPRSLTATRTTFPFFSFFTSTTDPRGRVR